MAQSIRSVLGKTTHTAAELGMSAVAGSGLDQNAVDARVTVGIAALGLGTAATTASTDYAAAAHAHAFASLTSKPTTLAGYGIADAVGSTDARLTDARTPTTHTHTFASLTGIPTTLAGYGISDAAAASHAHTFASLTSKPTTLSGYGITDAATSAQGALAATALQPGVVTSAFDAVQFPTPTTGQTQTFNTTKKNELIACNHVATIAAQTFVFPTDSNSQVGQELRIFSRSIITAVTLTLNSNTLIGLALTTLALNGNVAWRKVAASTWVRIQ